MNIKPIGNRLLVKLELQKNTTNSGIILSTKQENEQSKGLVVAIGAGQGTEDNINELNLKVGDLVLFGKYSGEEVPNENIGSDDVYKILNGKDILGKVK